MVSSIDGTITGTTSPDRVGLGVMATKIYSTFLYAPGVKPPHQIVLSHIKKTHGGGWIYPSAMMLSVF